MDSKLARMALNGCQSVTSMLSGNSELLLAFFKMCFLNSSFGQADVVYGILMIQTKKWEVDENFMSARVMKSVTPKFYH